MNCYPLVRRLCGSGKRGRGLAGGPGGLIFSESFQTVSGGAAAVS